MTIKLSSKKSHLTFFESAESGGFVAGLLFDARVGGVG